MTSELNQFLADGSTWLSTPPRREGKFLIFKYNGMQYGESSYNVYAVRGGFIMGMVVWNPSWRAWMFKPHIEGTFPMSALAELYAFIKERGGRQV